MEKKKRSLVNAVKDYSLEEILDMPIKTDIESHGEEHHEFFGIILE